MSVTLMKRAWSFKIGVVEVETSRLHALQLPTAHSMHVLLAIFQGRREKNFSPSPLHSR